MPKKKELSVIITVFNLSDVLIPCLKSIENQSVKPLEVIIIDDGSTDSSSQIIEQFLIRNPNWECFYTNNKGVSSARNFGVRKAKGEYLLILDGDDVFDKNFFSLMLNETKSSPDIVICGAWELDNLTNLSVPLYWNIRTKYLPKESGFSAEQLDGNVFYSFMGWAWDKMYRREFLIKNDLFFPELHNSEDLVFVYESLVLAKSIRILKDRLIFHRVNRSNSLSNSLAKYPKEYTKALDYIEKALKKSPEIFSREKQCYLAWKADFSLWAIKNSNQDVTSEDIRELNSWIVMSGEKSRLFPLLKIRMKLRFVFQNGFFLADIADLSSSCIKFGPRRNLTRLLSFIGGRLKKIQFTKKEH